MGIHKSCTSDGHSINNFYTCTSDGHIHKSCTSDGHFHKTILYMYFRWVYS